MKRKFTQRIILFLIGFMLMGLYKLNAQAPSIASFNPTSGFIGSTLTLTGNNLSNPISLTIGGVSAIVISNTGTNLVAMVMPGAKTGAISINTATGNATITDTFTISANVAPRIQQGSKLVGTGVVGTSIQGRSTSISKDGNTFIVGGPGDNGSLGAVWIYTRSGKTWSQQGSKLVGTGAVGLAQQGHSVSISADGNTAIVSGFEDNNSIGAAWVFTRSGNTWSQQGNKLVGTGAASQARQGQSVSISADGNTAIIGGFDDDGGIGATWVFTRSANTWSQQGSKLVGTGNVGSTHQGHSVSVSADGNTVIIGGYGDNGNIGAAWVFTRNGGSWSQQGSKLVGNGAVGQSYQGSSVSLSADGNTAMVGGYRDSSYTGAVWVFERSGSTWSQLGSKLVGTGAMGKSTQGSSVSISSDGNTAIVGGDYDNNYVGAAWVYIRNGNVWSQQGSKLVGTGVEGQAFHGSSVSISEDGNTAMVVGPGDNGSIGAAWVYTRSGSTWNQQGSKLVGTEAVGQAYQGRSVSISSDGNTAIVGGPRDNNYAGAAWVYTRSGNTWSQQGIKLEGTGAVGMAQQGSSVSISADGNTAIVGGFADNYIGAAWIFIRSGSTWSQQGNKLADTGVVSASNQGSSVSISADGNTAILGGNYDNNNVGAAWIYTRNGCTWSQKGYKLVGTEAEGQSNQGSSVSISADGNTAIVGGYGDNISVGAAWIFIRNGGIWSQQGSKLVGTGAIGRSYQGSSVSLNADGNTAMVGGNYDNIGIGAAWVYTRNGSTWSQQGSKLVGTGAIGRSYQGSSVSLNADGNTAMVGGNYDKNNKGAVWEFTRSGKIWSQQGSKFVGTKAEGSAYQGTCVSLSSDGNTAIVGGDYDNNNLGAAWVFSSPSIFITGIISTFTTCSGSVPPQQSFTISGTGLTADLVVSSPLGFEVSITSGFGFTSSVNLPQTSGTVNPTTIYIRLSKTATSSLNGNVVCSSTGVPSKNIAVSFLVNTATINITNINICPSELPYTWNGRTHNTAKTDTVNLRNALGCDSLRILFLAIKLTTTSTNYLSICSSQLPYTWNNRIYNTTQIDTVHLKNSIGCDSAAILNLSVYPSPNISKINGSSNAFRLDTMSYSVSDSQGSTFNWIITKGIIQSGAGTNQIQIKWIAEGIDTLKVIETSSQGCVGLQNTLIVNVSPTSSINEINASKKIIIYPNPTTGVVNISSSQAIDNVEVFDVTGKLVLSYRNDTHQKHIELDLSAFGNGIYFIQTHNQNAEKTLNKVVISK